MINQPNWKSQKVPYTKLEGHLMLQWRWITCTDQSSFQFSQKISCTTLQILFRFSPRTLLRFLNSHKLSLSHSEFRCFRFIFFKVLLSSLLNLKNILPWFSDKRRNCSSALLNVPWWTNLKANGHSLISVVFSIALLSNAVIYIYI